MKRSKQRGKTIKWMREEQWAGGRGEETKNMKKMSGRSRTTDLRNNIMQGGYIEAASHSIKEMQMTQLSWKSGAKLGRWRSAACSR